MAILALCTVQLARAQQQLPVKTLDSVKVKAARKTFGITRLKDVDGAASLQDRKSVV